MPDNFLAHLIKTHFHTYKNCIRYDTITASDHEIVIAVF